MSSLGFTGMDRVIQAELHAAFADAIEREGLPIDLRDDANADIVVVDMDSLYGPMSWMQLHNAGRKVVGYTSSSRSQSDFILMRPLRPDAVTALLQEAFPRPGNPAAAIVPPPASPVDAMAPAPIAAPVTETSTPAPAPQDLLPEETPSTVDIATAAPVLEPAAALPDADLAAPAIEPEGEPETPPAQASADEASEDIRLADWLAPGRLTARRKHALPGGTPLYLDPHAQLYHGPATLKPLEAAFSAQIGNADLDFVEDAEWAHVEGSHGPAQPWARLVWYGALLQGKGQLLAPLDPSGRFKLNRWVQTEREFPKHFRIATAMMKGPATIAEIANAASVTEADAADFVNACIATGVAEPVLPEPPATPDVPRSGLLGRLRSR